MPSWGFQPALLKTFHFLCWCIRNRPQLHEISFTFSVVGWMGTEVISAPMLLWTSMEPSHFMWCKIECIQMRCSVNEKKCHLRESVDTQIESNFCHYKTNTHNSNLHILFPHDNLHDVISTMIIYKSLATFVWRRAECCIIRYKDLITAKMEHKLFVYVPNKMLYKIDSPYVAFSIHEVSLC